MAVIHFINSKKAQTAVGMKAVLNYTMQDKKTVADGKKFVSGINCIPASAHSEFQNTKRLFHKETGRQYYHFVQSFAPGEAVTPELAHEIALRFASESEKLKSFEIVVSTHCDRDHIHSHFVMNSVNSETGKKFHISEREIDLLMQESDQLVQQYGLAVVSPQPKQKRNSLSAREYRSAYKGQSWKSRLMFAIDQAMCYADHRAEFIELMERQGYQVKWTRDRKYITYTTPEGFKCRDNKLHEEKYLKGSMEAEFRIRVDVFEDIVETGWEKERDRYELFCFEVEEENPVVDIQEEFADPDDLGLEVGFLVADLSNLIDDGRKIEDSTTMRRPRKQKKNEQDHGPVMG